jgi:2-succinyl-6-hydroxy-2,4-cyclohexadiene-1-carboxylate synthase
MIGARSTFVDTGHGMRLHARLAGSGPPLLLLHGFTGSAATWDELVELLSDRLTTVAVDLPGHGLSSAPSDPALYRLSHTAHYLARLQAKLGLERPAVLGYSMGGRVALRLALAGDIPPGALILESTSPGIADAEQRAARRKSDATLASLLEREGIEAFVNRWEALPLWASQASLPEARRLHLRRQRLSNDATGLANSLRGAGAGADPSVLDDLRTLATPTLLIAGELDTPYVEHAHAIHCNLPDSRIAVLPAAGHAAHFERPREFAELVREFVLERTGPH